MKRREILGLLPVVYQRAAQSGTPLHALAGAMEALLAPSERALAGLDAFFAPRRAPEEFLPLLASWVGLGHLVRAGDDGARTGSDVGSRFAAGPARLRELIAAAARLARWRGTARGLADYLETATGVGGFRVEEDTGGADGGCAPFHFRVVVPDEARRFERLVLQIIEFEKPAYVTYEWSYAPAPGGARP